MGISPIRLADSGFPSIGVIDRFTPEYKHADAEPVLRDCLKIRQAKQPDAWDTFNTQSMLGDALP
jgi:hypothetical protein